jgi:sugar lactone lactonase YvrE
VTRLLVCAAVGVGLAALAACAACAGQAPASSPRGAGDPPDAGASIDVAAYERAQLDAFARLRAKDPAGAVKGYERALALNPGDDVVTYLLALASFRARDDAAALAWLGRLADAGSNLVPQGDQFKELAQRPAYAAVADRIRANAARGPHGAAEAFRVPEKGLLCEGIAYDPVGRAFYLGSTTRRKIVRVVPGASGDGGASSTAVSDFAAPRQAIDSIGGLRVDAKRRRLWAVSGTDDRMDGFVKDEPVRNALLEFDLGTGALVGSYPLRDAAGDHGLNDVAVDADGRPYSTDTASGQLYTLSMDRASLVPVFDTPPFNFPNGLAFDDAGRILFVGDATGVHRVDLVTRSIARIPHPRGTSLSFFDGLYFARLPSGPALVGVQIIAGPGRVLAARMSPDLDAVGAVDLLEVDHPLFDGPTTGAVVGSDLFVIADSQLWGPRTPAETIVVRIPLEPAPAAPSHG